MPLAALLALLLLAPEETFTLRYRFAKGMTYRDRAERSFDMELKTAEGAARLKGKQERVLRRTVLGVDERGLPTGERIVVEKFVDTIEKGPADQIGARAHPSQGRTFVWKRIDGRWGLFDERGAVTGRYPHLVEHLLNWRDARLPPGPVALGATWEVPAERFLRTVGAEAPKSIQGRARFRLEGVEKGVARIAFEFEKTYRRDKRTFRGTDKGIWLFAIEAGRDLDFRMEGSMEVDGGEGGGGRFRMRRRVTYPAGAPPASGRGS